MLWFDVPCHFSIRLHIALTVYRKRCDGVFQSKRNFEKPFTVRALEALILAPLLQVTLYDTDFMKSMELSDAIWQDYLKSDWSILTCQLPLVFNQFLLQLIVWYICQMSEQGFVFKLTVCVTALVNIFPIDGVEMSLIAFMFVVHLKWSDMAPLCDLFKFFLHFLLLLC